MDNRDLRLGQFYMTILFFPKVQDKVKKSDPTYFQLTTF